MNSYQVTGLFLKREAGAVIDTMGQYPKFTPRGMSRLKMTQKQATANPASAQKPILRYMAIPQGNSTPGV